MDTTLEALDAPVREDEIDTFYHPPQGQGIKSPVPGEQRGNDDGDALTTASSANGATVTVPSVGAAGGHGNGATLTTQAASAGGAADGHGEASQHDSLLPLLDDDLPLAAPSHRKHSKHTLPSERPRP